MPAGGLCGCNPVSDGVVFPQADDFRRTSHGRTQPNVDKFGHRRIDGRRLRQPAVTKKCFADIGDFRIQRAQV